jgi:hypothetical protein
MLCKIWGFRGGDYVECCLCDVMPCGSCKNRCFVEIYRLHHQGGNKLLVAANVIPSSLIFSPWWYSRYVPPKRRLLQEPHGVTYQKKAFFWFITLDVIYRYLPFNKLSKYSFGTATALTASWYDQEFSLFNIVRTDPGVQPACYQLSTWHNFSGDKSAGPRSLPRTSN